MTKQSQGISDNESGVIQQLNLHVSMAAIKERSAKWLVNMPKYVADNPQLFTVFCVLASPMHLIVRKKQRVKEIVEMNQQR